MLNLPGKKKALLQEDDTLFLGLGVHVKGIVSFEGTVCIDGRLEGEIHTTGVLVVGERARITGAIITGTLISGGKTQASVVAHERMRLLKSAVLIGDMHSPVLSMEEGAHFHGACDMGNRKEKEAVYPHSDGLEKVRDFAAHRDKMRVHE